jgi:hypothetical protein
VGHFALLDPDPAFECGSMREQIRIRNPDFKYLNSVLEFTGSFIFLNIWLKGNKKIFFQKFQKVNGSQIKICTLCKVLQFCFSLDMLLPAVFEPVNTSAMFFASRSVPIPDQVIDGRETHADTPSIPPAAIPPAAIPPAAIPPVTTPSAASHGSENRENASGVPPACVDFASRMWNNFGETVLPLLGGLTKAAVLANRDPAQMTKTESRKIQKDILESSYSKSLFYQCFGSVPVFICYGSRSGSTILG